jgi:hypothetical protein
MMSDVLEDVKEETTHFTDEGDHDLFSHYARKKDIEDSIFNGTEIVALCGKKWRPSRDFTKFPVCGTCKDIYEGMNG